MSDMGEVMRAWRLLGSPFVDEELYRRALGGGRADVMTVTRYLQIPPAERPLLSFYFDPYYYIAGNPDVAGGDPLLHFLEAGFADRRAPHPLVDIPFLLGRDSHALGTVPLIDVLLDLLERDLASPSPYFDLAFYREQLGANAPASGLLRHFLTQGVWAQRLPNPWLDPIWYGDRNPDSPKDPYGALRHFVMVGDAEARPAGPRFDGRLYWQRYSDVAQAKVPPLRHYLTQGGLEGRQAAVEITAPTASASPSAGPADATQTSLEAAAADMRARIAALRQAQKEAVVPLPPDIFASTDPKADLARLRLAVSAAPVLSILVPIFNEVDITIECLLSVAAHLGDIAYEVVLGDDASTDKLALRFADVPGLRVLRHDRNVGFIANCNAAFALCRGRYVLLLNNDAQLMPGAAACLVAALDADATLAAVGPKIIYPDGRLQEAGCFLTPSGESGMVGLFADPEEPGYRRDRDVAYCSGAALMLRRSCVGDVLFDPAFAPAYCEDADLCLRLRAGGHRVRYIHDAVVMHRLSVSTNRQSMAHRLRTVTRNQQTLVERWGETLARDNAIRGIAFYLPQFHPTPENDLWWGAGFTEWTNVARARPSYAGHYQPHQPADLGFYDLRLPEALRAQAALAARYGIEGFCVYHYHFGSRRVLSQPLEVVRAHPDIAFRWCLCWANENWTRHWDGGEREILLAQSYDPATLDAVIGDAVADAADPRYLRVNGRPLFLVYRPLMLPDAKAFAARCRAAFAAAGFSGVHLVYVESMEAVDRGVQPGDIGFDACVEFPPHGRAAPASAPAQIVKPGWAGYRYDYPETVIAFLRRASVPYTRYPAVFPSWDNTPRQPMRGTSFDNATPEAFRVYVEARIDEIRAVLMGEERLLFINAWNEWAEGTHLEPDAGFGHRWLEAFRDALAAKRWH
jgi:GT2 family glycosyltransferase